MAKVAFFGDNAEDFARVYRPEQRAQIAARCEVYPTLVNTENMAEHLPLLTDLEVIFSTWGMPVLTREHLALLPRLKALFYAAGSVKTFAPLLLDRGITVVSAWGANAVPVAEFTLAQVVLANKGYFRNVRDCATPAGRVHAFVGHGNFDATLALLGAGMVGRKVIELARPFRLQILVYDPFLSAEAAARLGVEKVTLSDAFQHAQVVSNHLALAPETRNLLRRSHFERMPAHGVFINTGRGATVHEEELALVLQRRPDLTALLDVTFPEPPQRDAPFYALDNVFLTSHIAGSIGDEVVRMAQTMIEEFIAWETGNPLTCAVSSEMLARLA